MKITRPSKEAAAIRNILNHINNIFERCDRIDREWDAELDDAQRGANSQNVFAHLNIIEYEILSALDVFRKAYYPYMTLSDSIVNEPLAESEPIQEKPRVFD